ncbi:hypothetical protein OC842_001899 [Tilletia horrida]|uniref:Uncharacterized protein n=1 Tax=Tilletia horrida TaxID=155126 RepID=A0AAN6GJ27_9BASI|nr:hypothetical protein OC842_001899 [Tilletia horrida]
MITVQVSIDRDLPRGARSAEAGASQSSSLNQDSTIQAWPRPNGQLILRASQPAAAQASGIFSTPSRVAPVGRRPLVFVAPSSRSNKHNLTTHARLSAQGQRSYTHSPSSRRIGRYRSSRYLTELPMMSKLRSRQHKVALLLGLAAALYAARYVDKKRGHAIPGRGLTKVTNWFQ